jgi:hypothetical protein
MSSSGISRRMVLVRTDVSEELSASFIRVTGIGEIEKALAVTSSRRTLFLRSVRRLLVTASVFSISPGSYKSYTAYHPRKCNLTLQALEFQHCLVSNVVENISDKFAASTAIVLTKF